MRGLRLWWLAFAWFGIGSIPVSAQERLQGAGELQQGLVHCWFFSEAAAPGDGCGGAGLLFRGGSASAVIPGAGATAARSQRLADQLYAAWPGGNYEPVTAYSYLGQDASVGSWGDGRAHTLVVWMAADTATVAVTGTPLEAGTILSKEGEYALKITANDGGGITLVAGANGTGGGVAIPAAGYPHEPMVSSYPGANPEGPWYLVAISYDGQGKACVALNDSAAVSCATGVSVLQGKQPLVVGGSAFLQYVLEYDRLLTTAERQALYGAVTSSVAPYFTPVSTEELHTIEIAGSGCQRGNGWGKSFVSDGFTVPNPYTTCTFTTDAPVLYVEEQVLESASGESQRPNAAQIVVSLENDRLGEKPYAVLTPGSLGSNWQSVGLPGDGAVHAVTVDVSGYVGYSGNNDSPTKGMRAAVVTKVGVPAGWKVSAVAPPVVQNPWLFYVDSIGLGAETNFWETDGYIGQLRVSGGYPGEIELEAYGGRALYYDMPTPVAARQFADGLKSRWGCPARFTAGVMTNDYGKALWRAADGAGSMAAFWKEWNAICPGTMNMQQSAFLKVGETANTLGDSLQDWREALAAVCAAAKACTNHDETGPGHPGPGVSCPGLGTGGNFPSLAGDGLHLSTCGATMAFRQEFGTWALKPQTVTFVPLGGLTYGDAPVKLSATASSGGAVRFSVLSGPGKIVGPSGDELALTGAGGVVVEAQQAGNAEYRSTMASQTIVVNRAVLTVAGERQTMVEHTPVPVLRYTIHGLVNGDTLVGRPSLSTLVTHWSTPGNYLIHVGAGTLPAINYDIRTMNGLLVVQR